MVPLFLIASRERALAVDVAEDEFLVVEDFEVAKALFEAVENWAREKGMEYVHGPLGFNDFEREGLLVEGYDQLATFVENYNYPYYKDYIDKSQHLYSFSHVLTSLLFISTSIDICG